MPYLDESWERPSQERIDAGVWVPEIDRPGWNDRHLDLRAWIRREGLTPDALTNLQHLPPNEKVKHLLALGADIGSVQRDGFLYVNFLEQLKRAAPRWTEDRDADRAADDVVDLMKTIGLTSANWKHGYGGPPEPASPRRWGNVMNWLWGLLKQVGRFLVDSIEAFMALARDLIVDAHSHEPAITFSAGFPPALSIEISLAYFTQPPLAPLEAHPSKWSILRRFLDAILAQMGGLPVPGYTGAVK